MKIKLEILSSSGKGLLFLPTEVIKLLEWVSGDEIEIDIPMSYPDQVILRKK